MSSTALTWTATRTVSCRHATRRQLCSRICDRSASTGGLTMEHKAYKTVDAVLRDEDPVRGHVEPWGTTSFETVPVQHVRRTRTLAVVAGILGGVAAALLLFAGVGLWRGWF